MGETNGMERDVEFLYFSWNRQNTDTSRLVIHILYIMYNVIPRATARDIIQCVTLKILLTNQNQIVKYIQISQRKAGKRKQRHKKQREGLESKKH